MPYTILQDPETGLFELARLEPVLVGSFPALAMAEQVMRLLEAEETPPRPALPAPAETAASVTDPKPEPAKVAKVQTWDDAALAAAFRRLEAGERVKDVAATMNRPMPVLRGRWAAHKRRLAAEAANPDTPVEPMPVPSPLPVKAPQLPVVTGRTRTAHDKVSAAIGELKEQAHCSVCGKSFTATPASLDRCARCARD